MDTVLHAGLSNAAVAAAMALVLLPLARLTRRPALTHAMCVLILVKLVTPPLWRVPVSFGTNDTPGTSGPRASPVSGVPVSGPVLPPAGVTPATGPAPAFAAEAGPAVALADAARIAAEAPEVVAAVPPPAAVPTAAPAPTVDLTWRAVLPRVWAAGTALCLPAPPPLTPEALPLARPEGAGAAREDRPAEALARRLSDMAGRQSAAADLQRAHADVEAAKAELAAAKVRAQEAEARLRAAKAYLSEAEARGGDEAKGGDEPRPPTRRRADDAARPRIDPDAARRLEALEAELRKLREDLVGGRADKLSEELVGERAATADARGRLLMSYALKHASAKPAAEALSNLFSKAGVTVIVDERTNSLFIQGNSDRLDEIRHALAAMDAPPDGDAPADAPKNAPANGRR